jgi:hypothetical protein
MASVTSSTLGWVRRVVVVEEQDALAPDGVPGGERLAERRVGHLPFQVFERELLGEAHQARPLREAEDEELPVPVDARATELLQQRQAPHQPPRAGRDRQVGARHDPGGAALVDVEACHGRLDRRDELDRRRAGPDDGDAAALEVDVVVPRG